MHIDHLVLIDGHHLMYRAYWAIPRTLKTSSGEQTNTSFGVASMLLNILRTEEPTHLLFCFDAGEETFRHQENEEYKEGRAETPDDFYEQIPRVIECIEAFGILHISDSEYEADDFLGTYARAGEQAGMDVTVVTGDRDALQLVTDRIRMAIPHKGYQQAEYLDPKGVEAKYGVRPDQVPSYKGLCGDSSDNLPGVQGIGPKTASALLQQYGSLQGIYDHVDDIKPSWREKLERDREQAFFCERMAELVCDIPLAIPLGNLAVHDLPVKPAFDFFHALEFTVLIKRFQSLLDSPYGQEHFKQEDIPSSVSVEEGVDQMTLF